MLRLQNHSSVEHRQALIVVSEDVPHFVEDLIRHDPRKSAWIRPSDRISDVLAKLEFEDVGALVVSAKGHRIDGIISERDVVRGMRYYGEEIFDLPVEVLMQDNVITCQSEDTVQHATHLMQLHHIRHLPVTNGSKFVGLLSLRDVLPSLKSLHN